MSDDPLAGLEPPQEIDLGPLCFEVEPRPFAERLKRSNNGPLITLLAFSLFTAVAAMVTTLALAVAFGWLPDRDNPKPGERERFRSLFAAMCVPAGLAFGWLVWRTRRDVRAVAIAVHEHGIEIRRSRPVVRRRWQDLHSVYFGMHKQPIPALMADGKMIRRHAANWVTAAVLGRCNFLFLDGTRIPLPHFIACFTDAGVDRLFAAIQTHCPQALSEVC